MNSTLLPLRAQSPQHRLAGGLVLVGYEDHELGPQFVMASAFNSLSLTPKLVMWCAAQGIDGRPRIPIGAHCGLSVMAADHRDLWAQCAKDCNADRFQWTRGPSLEVPLVENAAANFEVIVTQQIVQGSHVLCIGEVQSFDYSETCEGLLSYQDDLRIPLTCE
ncbi:flavin reductase [Allopusillimonas soli]|uniref:Flavin reductase family protein n=1 Tax=Allopusillimonas soli TaxID=659016 RepID=A0A853FC17_9BURK|nr:flavin reductase family protein [Allopusillimonas soli]NYT36091.1 flavin reductase family protein [Allopusillimonas soli]TEA76427.1 flavin reductase [Allopusillimonas soli]